MTTTTATELCPACLTELPADYPYDHVAIDQALAGRRIKLANDAERGEAVRIGVAHGMTLNQVALRLRIAHSVARQVPGLADIQAARREQLDAQVTRLVAAGHSAYAIAGLTDRSRRAVQASLDRLQRRDTCGHVWPAELDEAAACLHCGLTYREWSQDGVAA